MYEIIRTDKADNQLREIIFYITDDSGSVDVAISYLDKIEKAINLLKNQPYYGVEPRYTTLRRQKFRVLMIEKHLVFYKVREEGQTIIIYAIVDSRREYLHLII